MRASDLRHRITIQRRTTTQDDTGAPTQTWVDFATNVPAAIRPLSSRELMAAQAVQSETSHEITMRYLPGVVASMRAVFNGRYFNLARPLNVDERNFELIIPATEGLNDG